MASIFTPPSDSSFISCLPILSLRNHQTHSHCLLVDISFLCGYNIPPGPTLCRSRLSQIDFACRRLLYHMASVLCRSFGFNGTLTTLLRSIQRFLLFANVSWSICLVPIFHPLVHTARPILPGIPVMYPYFNYSYLPYQ